MVSYLQKTREITSDSSDDINMAEYCKACEMRDVA